MLNLEQLRCLDAKHVVGCHTSTHCRLGETLAPEKLQQEILGVKAEFEQCLGHAMKIFCWVGGEEFSYSQEAAQLIKEGYDLSFMTNSQVIRPSTNPLQLQRTNIEATYPLWFVRFYLSGLADIVYAAKRRRVNRLTR